MIPHADSRATTTTKGDSCSKPAGNAPIASPAIDHEAVSIDTPAPPWPPTSHHEGTARSVGA
ncbi:hypothetical protein BJF84_17410 [Rhodococcus sp. CUA-806]|nr:hypothetical protein BJF84_17410 [Rhodococcus sp. CUA-806]